MAFLFIIQRYDVYNPQAQPVPAYPVNGFSYASRSRSVPEGLAHDCQYNYGPNFYHFQTRPGVQVVEQITTSV